MRVLSALLSLCLVAPVSYAAAGDQPVVVELYTSQGCSSCPPADRVLSELATRDDVLPLALHVDYWDYIGWPDEFADPRFTARQKAYAQAKGERMIYTPQAVVAGEASMIGSKAGDIDAAIARHRAAPDAVDLRVNGQGGTVQITAQMTGDAPQRRLLIQVVPFTPRARVDIRGGENAGAVVDYANIATDWQIVGEWDGTGTWEGTAFITPPAAVLVQEMGAGLGAILGAQRVD
ncbi:hypothetical protein PARPLA_01866 [Rhodobacteraceae bacterium THAF1]|uniref:DUF1223 domain-containing protein n=1 Tax=Palleronia sp. THAF1 TaxID=2587842 RepID=UPI000F4002E4|nr:DUF1223 domain-containing protein [Palleronia sp. THAF1]QFU08999.1 hypothetical protein FIU81_09970 [Palleronia sp. THAF1]VDC24262.1 hypothetical protein PARPLA_01866 [Rhodobacteraceae bacterium THAF1]